MEPNGGVVSDKVSKISQDPTPVEYESSESSVSNARVPQNGVSQQQNGIYPEGDIELQSRKPRQIAVPLKSALKSPSKGEQIGVQEDTNVASEALSPSPTGQSPTQSEVSNTSKKIPPSAFEKAAKRPELSSSTSLRDKEDEKSTSLPPEILGLFTKKEDTTGREVGHQHSRAFSQASGLGSQTSEIPQVQDNLVIHRAWNLATVDSCPVIMLPNDFQPKEGTKLSDDLIVGKHLSSGLQGGVYDLVKADGSQAQVVFKWVHKHALLAEVEREWEVGMRLNQLAYSDGSLPGFMGVGAGIRATGKFRGMLLERLQGTTVDKVICTKNFHDVQYVYDMLYSVFTALDRAQGALGFHHSDLRLANVMEIKSSSDSSRGASERSESEVNERTREKQPPTPVNKKDPINSAASPAENSVRHKFKIIDYGLADFEETFAAGPDVILEDEAKSQPSRKSLSIQRQNSISPATGCVAAFPFPMIRKDKLGKLPSPSPIERLYRFMWRRKGDVYHLVFELGEWLDGRVWPEEDELDVLRLVDLVHHVTGVKIKAFFSDEMSGEESVAGWRDQACGPFERHDSAMHFLRRWNIRLRSWLNPSNPGLTAAEALTAPFFTKRISLRGVIHGCSTRYSKWTKVPSRRKRKSVINDTPARISRQN